MEASSRGRAVRGIDSLRRPSSASASLAIGAILALWASIALWWAWFAIPVSGHAAHLQVTITGEASARHQVYFGASPSFSESKSSLVRAAPSGTANYALRLTPVELRYLRVDLGTDQPARLCQLDITSGTQQLAALEDFNVLRTKQLAGVEQERGCIRIRPERGALDPYAVFVAPDAVQAWTPPVRRSGLTGVLAAALLGVAAVMLLLATRHQALTTVLERTSDVVHRFLPGIYLAAALVFGAAYVAVTPPGAVPDEIAHATKTVKVAAGALMGGTGDRHFPNPYHMYGEFNGFRNPATRFTPSQLAHRTAAPVLCEPTTSSLPKGADSYGPHLYLAPAAMYAAACAVEGSFGSFLWSARAGNLLLSALLTAAGIWFSHRARWPLFVIALMPMTIYQVASISADSLYFGLCFAWVGLLCGLAEGKVPVARAGPVLMLLALLLAFSKPGGAWVLSGVLFLRSAFIASYGRFWPALITFMVVPLGMHVLWVLGAGGDAVPLAGVDPEYNLAQIWRDPLHVADLFLTAFSGTHGIGLARSMIGQLGWLDVPLPGWGYGAVCTALAASLLLAREGRKPPVTTRALAIGFALGSLVMLAIPLYLFWTPPDAVRVGGLQGRYFIPSLAFAGVWLTVSAPARIQAPIILLLPAAMALPLLQGLLAVAMRYYPL